MLRLLSSLVTVLVAATVPKLVQDGQVRKPGTLPLLLPPPILPPRLVPGHTPPHRPIPLLVPHGTPPHHPIALLVPHGPPHQITALLRRTLPLPFTVLLPRRTPPQVMALVLRLGAVKVTTAVFNVCLQAFRLSS